MHSLDNIARIRAGRQMACCGPKLNFEQNNFHSLNLAFSNTTLRMICEHEESAIERYGQVFASKLKSRLADMLAANCVTELVVGSPAEIEIEEAHLYKVDLLGSQCLIFSSGHTKTPLLPNGKPDWHQVSRIKLINIR
jgi:proteic killer suppression protein